MRNYLAFWICIFGANRHDMQGKWRSITKNENVSKSRFSHNKYTQYDTTSCVFTFKYPVYTKIVKDQYIFDGKPIVNVGSISIMQN